MDLALPTARSVVRAVRVVLDAPLFDKDLASLSERKIYR
jgi:hypothetical protein